MIIGAIGIKKYGAGEIRYKETYSGENEIGFEGDLANEIASGFPTRLLFFPLTAIFRRLSNIHTYLGIHTVVGFTLTCHFSSGAHMSTHSKINN